MAPEAIAATELRRFDRQFEAIRTLTPERVRAATERAGRWIVELGAGGFLRCGGRTYRVEGIAQYHETDEKRYEARIGEPWIEYALVELETGETCYVEWEQDDALEIYFTRRRLRFRDLADEDGAAVDEDDLDPATESEDSFFLDDREFAYEDDYAAVYRRDRGDAKEEPVYFYEFLADNGDVLTVEEWIGRAAAEDSDYQLWLSERLEPDAVEIIALES